MNFNPKLLNYKYARWIIYGVLLLMIAEPLHSFVLSKQPSNGFDLTDSLIPAAQIHHGGPPRDGIPALTNPKLIDARDATYIRNTDRVLGIVINGEARAYPINILNHHEIVNDLIDDKHIVVTYCPLCGSGVAFDGNINGKKLEFGVSGLLYNSDVLLYDRQTESLWSQLMAKAISGKMKGTRLKTLPVDNTSWKNWQRLHPDTQVLSNKTGYQRDYRRNPYWGYDATEDVYFPLTNRDKRFPTKELVAGLEWQGKYRAYPFSELLKAPSSFHDPFAGNVFRVTFNKVDKTARIETRTGKVVPVTVSYWFAWAAFHPQTEIYYAKGKSRSNVRKSKR